MESSFCSYLAVFSSFCFPLALLSVLLFRDTCLFDNFIITEDNQSVFKHLANEDLSTWLDDYNYSISDLWEKNLIGGRSDEKADPEEISFFVWFTINNVH